MRKILFRGKEINTNKWCYGGYVRKVLFKNTKDEKIRHIYLMEKMPDQ